MLGEKNTTKIFVFESASVRIRKIAHNKANLTNLYSASPQRGHASKVMQLAVDWADAKGLHLYLIVQSYGRSDGLNNEQLRDFYAKFGFIQTDRRPIQMYRAWQPSQK